MRWMSGRTGCQTHALFMIAILPYKAKAIGSHDVANHNIEFTWKMKVEEERAVPVAPPSRVRVPVMEPEDGNL